MRIGIDCRTVEGDRTGLGVYTENLVDNLLEDYSTDNNYSLYFSRVESRTSKWRHQSQQYVLKAPLTNLWTHISLPLHLRKHPVDIYHFPNFIVPIVFPYKTVVTIHDLNFLRFPKSFTLRTYLALATQIRLSAQKADAIIAVSESTKLDIVEMLKIPEKKVTVIYNGVNERFKSPQKQMDVKVIKQKYGLDNYILCVGSIVPQKNLVRLLNAFALLKKSNTIYQLAIVGGSAWKSEAVLKEIKRLNLSREVIMTGYVSDDDLPLIYSGATVFVYPSLYEGFGLPVLEAMACGTPVITSNVSSLPEVSGSAAILVDPYNIDEISEAMRRVVQDKNLQQELIDKGLEQVKKFSFNKMAKETFIIYEQLI